MAQPGTVEIPKRLGRAVQVHQVVAEAAVPNTVVEGQLPGGKAFAELPINPEFIAIPAKTDRLSGFIEVEKVRPQPFGYGVFRDFGKRALRETLLAVEDLLHPTQGDLPWTAGRLGRDIDRHRERTQVPFEPSRRPINGPPARRPVVDRLVDIEQQHAADPWRLSLPFLQGLGVRLPGRVSRSICAMPWPKAPTRLSLICW